MGLVQIGVKMDSSIKERIKAIVETGKYRDMTDFALTAILEKLAQEESGFNPDEKVSELESSIAELQETLRVTNLQMSSSMAAYETSIKDLDARLRRFESR